MDEEAKACWFLEDPFLAEEVQISPQDVVARLERSGPEPDTIIPGHRSLTSPPGLSPYGSARWFRATRQALTPSPARVSETWPVTDRV